MTGRTGELEGGCRHVGPGQVQCLNCMHTMTPPPRFVRVPLLATVATVAVTVVSAACCLALGGYGRISPLWSLVGMTASLAAGPVLLAAAVRRHG